MFFWLSTSLLMLTRTIFGWKPFPSHWGIVPICTGKSFLFLLERDSHSFGTLFCCLLLKGSHSYKKCFQFLQENVSSSHRVNVSHSHWERFSLTLVIKYYHDFLNRIVSTFDWACFPNPTKKFPISTGKYSIWEAVSHTHGKINLTLLEILTIPTGEHFPITLGIFSHSYLETFPICSGKSYLFLLEYTSNSSRKTLSFHMGKVSHSYTKSTEDSIIT